MDQPAFNRTGSVDIYVESADEGVNVVRFFLTLTSTCKAELILELFGQFWPCDCLNK